MAEKKNQSASIYTKQLDSLDKIKYVPRSSVKQELNDASLAIKKTPSEINSKIDSVSGKYSYSGYNSQLESKMYLSTHNRLPNLIFRFQLSTTQLKMNLEKQTN